MSGNILLLFAELRKRFILWMRYPFNAVIGIIFFYGIFVAVYFGMHKGGIDMNNRKIIGEWIIGYLIWLYVLAILGETAEIVERESEVGTLEQIYLNCQGLIKVIIARTIADCALMTVVNILPIFFLAILTTSFKFSMVSLFKAFPFFIFTLVSVFGLSLFLGGITLIFKKTGPLITLFQILFLGVAFIPLVSLTSGLTKMLKIFPTTRSLALTREIALSGAGVRISEIVILIVMVALFLIVGILVFSYAERVAKKHGLLSHY